MSYLRRRAAARAAVLLLAAFGCGGERDALAVDDESLVPVFQGECHRFYVVGGSGNPATDYDALHDCLREVAPDAPGSMSATRDEARAWIEIWAAEDESARFATGAFGACASRRGAALAASPSACVHDPPPESLSGPLEDAPCTQFDVDEEGSELSYSDLSDAVLQCLFASAPTHSVGVHRAHEGVWVSVCAGPEEAQVSIEGAFEACVGRIPASFGPPLAGCRDGGCLRPPQR